MSESFPYRGNFDTMLLGVIFFGSGAALFGYKTATNDRGLIINGVIELGPTGATIFYAVLGVLSALFVLCAVFAQIQGALRKPMLILADDHLVVPSGFFQRRLKRVEFKHITSAVLQKISGQQFLVLRTLQGKVSVTRSLLTPPSAFDLIVTAVNTRMPQSPEKLR